MVGVAVAGCVLFAIGAVTNGDFTWREYTSVVGLFTLACAGSWGLSAVYAVIAQAGRRPPQSAGERFRTTAPWERSRQASASRPPMFLEASERRTIPVAWLAVGAFGVGLGGVFLFNMVGAQSNATDRVTIIRGGAVSHAEPSGAGPGAPSAGTAAVAAERYGVCRSPGQQSCVVDGDTIRHKGLKIRIADIDTPEISEPKCASEAALGHRAKDRLVELLNKGPFEIVPMGGRDEDVYGRKLRVLMRDGRSIGMILVEEGFARRWTGARRSWCL
jgi:micrococcal nuclease